MVLYTFVKLSCFVFLCFGLVVVRAYSLSSPGED